MTPMQIWATAVGGRRQGDPAAPFQMLGSQLDKVDLTGDPDERVEAGYVIRAV